MKRTGIGIDTMKVLYTYSIATIIIAGGIWFLFLSRNDPQESNTQTLIPVITGFIGAAIQFVFNRETQSTTAAQIAKATDAANVNAANVLSSAGVANTLQGGS